MENAKATDDAQLDQLRALLLKEDRPSVARLEALLNDPVQLGEKVGPILEQRLEFFKQHFPAEYREVVDKLIQDRIRSSQSEIVDVISPVLGSMVRKYIEHQFQVLKESIEERIRETREQLNFWKRFKARFSGVSEAEMALTLLNKPIVEEVYLVERDSGILLAHASRRENLDREAVAGMLTAIKAFVEDAFRREKEELDYIAYDHYKILVQNFSAYYLAALVQGSVSARERDTLNQQLRQFINESLVKKRDFAEEAIFSEISAQLEAKFIGPGENNK